MSIDNDIKTAFKDKEIPKIRKQLQNISKKKKKESLEINCPKCPGKILYILENHTDNGVIFKIYKCYNCGYQEKPNNIIKLFKYLETLIEKTK